MNDFIKGTLFGFFLAASIVVGLGGGWLIGFIVGLLM